MAPRAKAKPKASTNGSTPKGDTRPAIYLEAGDGKRQRTVPAKTFYGLDSSPSAQLDYLAHFMTDKKGGKYLSKKAALAVLFFYNMGEITDMLGLLQDALAESTFPNE